MMLSTTTTTRTKTWSLFTAACAVWAALSAGGCYDARQVQAFLQTPRRPVSGVEYRVYPPDTIMIRSAHVNEINRTRQRVRPDGKVNLPLLGEVFIAGKTPKEIEGIIIKAASKFYEQADATVEVVSYASQHYYVFGQVSRPGAVQWTGRDTVLDALARAHPTNLAWFERVAVTRGAKPAVGGYFQPSGKYYRTGVHPPTEDNKPSVLKVNLVAMIEEGDMGNNVLLMPNDVIYVQASPLAKVGLMFQRLLFPIRPALETASVPARAATVGMTP